MSEPLPRTPPKEFLILGCGGFIGSHLIEALLERPGGKVVGWDPDLRKIDPFIGNGRLILHERRTDDPGTLGDLRAQIANADVVVNLAAICNPSWYNTRPLEVIRANFTDSTPIVEMCAEHATWLVHFSTSEVYGRTIASYVGKDGHSDPALYELDEDTTPLVLGPIKSQRWSYAAAKQLLERFIFAHHKEHGLPFTIVRPLNFFGPRMDFIQGHEDEGIPRVLACFTSALLRNEPLKLVDGGSARRTITSIHDATDALVRIFASPEKAVNQIFNIGNRDNEVSIAELAEMIRATFAEVSGDPAYLSHPIEVVSGDQFYGEGYEDCDRRMPKTEKAHALLGWTPKILLKDILREAVEYYYRLYGR